MDPEVTKLRIISELNSTTLQTRTGQQRRMNRISMHMTFNGSLKKAASCISFFCCMVTAFTKQITIGASQANIFGLLRQSSTRSEIFTTNKF